jgi:para-aminobenzoate synthetase component I
MEIFERPYSAIADMLPLHGTHVALISGRAPGRWSMVGWDPWWEWDGASGSCDALDAMLAHCQRAVSPRTVPIPVPLFMGGLSYDFGAAGVLGSQGRHTASVPPALLFAFRRMIINDEHARRSWAVTMEPVPIPEALRVTRPAMSPVRQRVETFGSNFSQESYCAAVCKIRAMIGAGDCYQVNLSQQFSGATSQSGATIFRDSLVQNPAPMMAYLATEGLEIISTSPERLVARAGDYLCTEPIKGTAPRSADATIDAQRRHSLMQSTKDRAELAMIVDLMRNDLGRIATVGSVRVAQPCRLESYANVHHLAARVEARAQPHLTWAAIFQALLPGGSVTGCPKIQAMRVIEALEGVSRGFYCGTLGYIDINGNGDWNIAIRTATKIGDQIVCPVGGGIVYDSDPEREYQETLHKGETLFHVLQRSRPQTMLGSPTAPLITGGDRTYAD